MGMPSIVLINHRVSRLPGTPAGSKSTVLPDRAVETVEAINQGVSLSVEYDEVGHTLQSFFRDCGQVLQVQLFNLRQSAIVEHLEDVFRCLGVDGLGSGIIDNFVPKRLFKEPKCFVGRNATGSVLVFNSAALYRISRADETSTFRVFGPVRTAAWLPIRLELHVEIRKTYRLDALIQELAGLQLRLAVDPIHCSVNVRESSKTSWASPLGSSEPCRLCHFAGSKRQAEPNIFALNPGDVIA